MTGVGRRFAGKGAIVTGGARGIGLACARRLGLEGARVLLLDRLNEDGEAAAAALRNEGAEAWFMTADVADCAQLERAVDKAIAWSGVDILVCAAGIGDRGACFLDASPDEFEQIHRVNLLGPMLLGQMVARHMAETRRKGSIVHITSVAAELATPDQVGYCVSKAGLAMLTKAMATSLAAEGIRVNAVGPGPVRTEMSERYMQRPGAHEDLMLRLPLGRLGEVDEIAATVAFLASEDAGFITGQTIYADGGRLALNHVVRPPLRVAGTGRS